MKIARTNKQIKKGFTLVELLCVIVILGVISTMAIAGISNLISKSKEEKNNQNKKFTSNKGSTKKAPFVQGFVSRTLGHPA